MKDAVLAAVDGSLDRVLKFYERQKTPLGYIPRIAYVDDLHGFGSGVLARAKEEDDLHESFSRLLAKHFGRAIFRDMYGLRISEEAASEIPVLSEGNGEKHADDLLEEYDIVFYRPFADSLSALDVVDRIAAHEVWHLIEREHRLTSGTPFIMEGTATYAMLRYNGAEFGQYSLPRTGGIVDVLYSDAAKIVHEAVKDEENPYLAMLDTDLRIRMQDEFLRRFNSKMVESVIELMNTGSFKEMASRSMLDIPELRMLKGRLSKDNILNTYREIGLVKTADELATQDLTRLIDRMRELGF